MEPLYVAGFFDGEGSVGLYRGAKNAVNFRVQITQNLSTEVAALFSEFVTEWGGHVSQAVSLSGNQKLNWQLGQIKAAKFLTDIQPHVVVKRPQVDLALSWLGQRPTLVRDARGKYISRSEADNVYTNYVITELKRLKKGE